MLIGYARCPTDAQDLTAQRDALTALGVKPTGSTSTMALPVTAGPDQGCAKRSPAARKIEIGEHLIAAGTGAQRRVGGGSAALAGSAPATPALITGAITWLLLTARADLAPPG